jgi:diacylglycerol kinase family enzyme
VAPRILPRRVLVIANPMAGLRRGRPAGELAAAGAAAAGASVELYKTVAPADAWRRAAEAALESWDLVIAAGGDGTIHEVANGLAGSDVPLALAPAGTMNLLARVLRTPLDPRAAAEHVVSGFTPLPMLPGEADGRLFLLMVGAGFDAWVLRELLRGARGKIAFRHYVRGAVRGLATFPFPPLVIDGDTGRHEAHTVIVGRAPLYGGFLRPTPGVTLDSPSLEVCALSGGVWRLARLIPRMWSGAHRGAPGVLLRSTRSVTIEASVPDVPYQLDGELAGSLPVTIRVAQRRVVLASTRRPFR